MEILVYPIVRIPLSASLMRSKGMQAIHLALISSAAGAVDEMSKVIPNNFRSSIPVLLLGFAPFYHLPIKAMERDLPFDTERALSTKQLSYQPQEAVLLLTYLGLLRILHDRRRWPQWSDQRVRIASPCPLPGGVLVRVLRSCI